MKERFTKLLLGEDMSGGGKGVCTALAISNCSLTPDMWAIGAIMAELFTLRPLFSGSRLFLMSFARYWTQGSLLSLQKRENLVLLCLLVCKDLGKQQLVQSAHTTTRRRVGNLLWFVQIPSELVLLTS